MGIGKNIRRYRQEANMTQEKLAELLNVSVSAVSQWEGEKTIPDLSMLPALCNLFQISADILLDINLQENKKEIEKILDEAEKHSSRGKNAEAEKILSMGLLRFPNSYEIMTKLMYAYFNLCWNEKDENAKSRYEETVISLGNRIINGCTEGELRSSAIQVLCYVYAGRKEYEKAKELAYKMPPMACCREGLMSAATIGTECLEFKQSEIFNLIQRLGVMMVTMNVVLEDNSDAYSENERAALREKQLSFIKLMFENEDYGFFHDMLARSNALQAQYYAKKCDAEKTLDYLKEAMNCALAFQNYDPSDKHTSLLFRNREFGDFSTNAEKNLASQVLEIAAREDFDFLKEDEKYHEIKRTLEKESGCW